MRSRLPLRDRLAIDRTDLAIQRTWLAHARTALALFVTGASFLQFFQLAGSWIVGLLFILGSVPVLAHGWRQFRAQRRQLSADTADAVAQLERT